LAEDTQVLCKNGKMVIPTFLQNQAVSWYRQYLQHPGHTCLVEMLHAAMHWKCMKCTIRSQINNCHTCQVNDNISTCMGNSLQSLSSQTLGRHWV
jgi:hypothetical protein